MRLLFILAAALFLVAAALAGCTFGTASNCCADSGNETAGGDSDAGDGSTADAGEGPSDSGVDAGAADASVPDGGTSVPGLTSTHATNQACAVNVKDFGAAGDGGHDDTAAIESALAAGPAGAVVCFPAGSYRTTSAITVPDDRTLQGEDMTNSWIMGAVYFGSSQTYRNLKLGDEGDVAVRNQNGASNVAFENVHFRGGGGASEAPVVKLGGSSSANVSGVTFTNCEVERNLTVVTGGYGTPFYNAEYNDIRVTAVPGTTHVAHLTFDHCHIGVDNGASSGRTLGSPRAGIEVWTSPDGVAACVNANATPSAIRANCRGWEDVNLTNSVWEAADSLTIDLADYPMLDDSGAPLTSAGAVRGANGGTRASGPARVSGNLIKGAGYEPAAPFPHAVAIEYPTGVVIENNTIWGSRSQTIAVSNYGDPNLPGAIIRNNVIDLTRNVADYAPSPGGNVIAIEGGSGNTTCNTTVADNTLTVTGPSSRHTFYLELATGSRITGNRVDDRSTSGCYAVQLYNATGNIVTGNTFATAASSADGIADCGGNTVSDNTFLTNQ